MAPRSHPADSTHPETQSQPAPSTSKSAEANGLKLHYLDYGTEGLPPMLCVHGGAAHGHWFDFVAPGFTPGYHVRALDLRGHGDSAWPEPRAYSFRTYADDVAAVVEQLDLRDFVLIGHSMGGMVSLHYAALPLWEKVKIPALLVRGEKSTRLGAEEFTNIRARSPQVDLAEVPASDHHITLDNPAGFVKVVREFLRKAG